MDGRAPRQPSRVGSASPRKSSQDRSFSSQASPASPRPPPVPGLCCALATDPGPGPGPVVVPIPHLGRGSGPVKRNGQLQVAAALARHRRQASRWASARLSCSLRHVHSQRESRFARFLKLPERPELPKPPEPREHLEPLEPLESLEPLEPLEPLEFPDIGGIPHRTLGKSCPHTSWNPPNSRLLPADDPNSNTLPHPPPPPSLRAARIPDRPLHEKCSQEHSNNLPLPQSTEFPPPGSNWAASAQSGQNQPNHSCCPSVPHLRQRFDPGFSSGHLASTGLPSTCLSLPTCCAILSKLAALFVVELRQPADYQHLVALPPDHGLSDFQSGLPP